MTDKKITLARVLHLAECVLADKGRGYRNLVHKNEGDESTTTGCVNVVAVKDGKRYLPAAVQYAAGGYPAVSALDVDAELAMKHGFTMEPGCFVGTILIEGGYVTVEQFSCNGGWGAPARDVAHNFKLDFTPAALSWLVKAQGKQDGGSTWGEAYDYACTHTLTELARNGVKVEPVEL